MATLKIIFPNVTVSSPASATDATGSETYYDVVYRQGKATTSASLKAIPKGAKIKKVSLSYNISRDGDHSVKIKEYNYNYASSANLNTYLASLNGVYNSSITLQFNYKNNTTIYYTTSWESQKSCTYTNITLTIDYEAGATVTDFNLKQYVKDGINLTFSQPQIEGVTTTIYTYFKNNLGGYEPISSAYYLTTDASGSSILYHITKDDITNAISGKISSESAEFEGKVILQTDDLDPTEIDFTLILTDDIAAPDVNINSISFEKDADNNDIKDQYYAKPTIEFSVTPKYGAAINQIVIDLGGKLTPVPPQEDGTITYVVTSNLTISKAGEIPIGVIVKDSRGLTSSTYQAEDINQIPSIQVNYFEARRFARETTTLGYEDVDAAYGSYVWFNYQFSYSTARENRYNLAITSPSFSEQTKIELLNKNDGDNGVVTGTHIVWIDENNPIDIDSSLTPTFTLVLTNTNNNIPGATISSTINKARCNMHLSGSDYGVAIGKFCDSSVSAEAPLFEVNYPTIFYHTISAPTFKGIFLNPDGEELGKEIPEDRNLDFSHSSYFSNYSTFLPAKLTKVGKFVYLSGQIFVKTALGGGLKKILVADNLDGFAPKENLTYVCTSETDGSIYDLDITTSGKIYISRYRTQGTSYSTLAAGAVLQLKSGWRIADGKINTFTKYPTIPLLSNSSNGYSCAASSTYSSTYDVFKAFNGTLADGWASSSFRSPQYIQITLPDSISNVVVEIFARIATPIANPTSGKIYGSNDGGTTLEQIGEFSEWNTSGITGTSLGVIQCENTDAYNTIRIVFETGVYSEYVAIGDINIYGNTVS